MAVWLARQREAGPLLPPPWGAMEARVKRSWAGRAAESAHLAAVGKGRRQRGERRIRLAQAGGQGAVLVSVSVSVLVWVRLRLWVWPGVGVSVWVSVSVSSVSGPRQLQAAPPAAHEVGVVKSWRRALPWYVGLPVGAVSP